MKRLGQLSKELQLLLSGVIALAVVALLKPEPLLLPDLPPDVGKSQTHGTSSSQGRVIWTRQPVTLEETSTSNLSPAELTEPVQSSEPVTEQPVLTESSPLTLNLVYRGRILNKAGPYVLIDAGQGVQALKRGDLLADGWRIERITSSNIELHNQQLGLTQELPIQ
ncbi:hypothetical protein D3C76_218450 [compost metagenome]